VKAKAILFAFIIAAVAAAALGNVWPAPTGSDPCHEWGEDTPYEYVPCNVGLPTVVDVECCNEQNEANIEQCRLKRDVGIDFCNEMFENDPIALSVCLVEQYIRNADCLACNEQHYQHCLGNEAPNPPVDGLSASDGFDKAVYDALKLSYPVR
jgi:hypothetical protein